MIFRISNMNIGLWLSILSALAALSSFATKPIWISADDVNANEPNTWIEFQKEINIEKVPDNAEARIGAESKYWLWINDSLAVFEGGLKRGPNPRDSYYDVVDIASFLKKGKNNLRVLVCHFGKSGFSHVNTGSSGLIIDIPSLNLATDSTWLSRRLPEYGTVAERDANYRLAESSIRYDALKEQSGTFKASIGLGEWGAAPFNKMVERPIPLHKDYGLKSVSLNKTNDDEGNIVLTCRLPYNMQFTPVLTLSDSLGGTTVRIETDHVFGGSADCIRAEYVTRKGNQCYESLGWLNGDELKVIYPEASGVEITDISVRESGYNASFSGSFTCNDSIVNRFWQKAMRTLYVNMRDNYFDCPDRERAQWWGDVTVLMGQSFYQLSPEANALMKKAINELVDWQRPDGTLFSPIPAGNWDKELPAQMLAAISTYGFWYYYVNTGDELTLRHSYPAMKRYLDIWKLDNDGLTKERDGGWSWGDWGTNIDLRLILAAWHHLALQSAANTARLLGEVDDIEGYEVKMTKISDAFNRCWNGFAYRHPSYHGETDDRVQAMAVLCGIAPESYYPQIVEVIKKQEHASPYMEKYVLEALVKMGQGKYALDRFKKRFANMITDNAHSTLYEGWEEGGYGGGSTNHAWSGGMLTVICENICGIRPLEPGWKSFKVAPNPILTETDITIPSVAGEIKSSFRSGNDSFSLVLDVPNGTEAEVVLPAGFLKGITVNGVSKTDTDLKGLPAGHYDIKAYAGNSVADKK
ncbi:MAG: hypothetical protein NC082_02315 [Clostridiales bacterium]|nr:hypothetical protein [Clostridiales bacterium]